MKVLNIVRTSMVVDGCNIVLEKHLIIVDGKSTDNYTYYQDGACVTREYYLRLISNYKKNNK